MTALGSVLVYLGFGAGVPALVWTTVKAWKVPSREGLVSRGHLATAERDGANVGGTWAVVALLGLASGALLMTPWLRGTGVEGRTIELAGFTGLDVLSAGFLFATDVGLMAFASCVWLCERFGDLELPHPARTAAEVRAGCAALTAAALAVTIGNILIQAAQPGGSRVAWGAWASLAVAATEAVACALLWRRGPAATLSP